MRQEFINLRKQLGLTQVEIGKILGISGRQVSNIEKGESTVKEWYLEKMKEYRNISNKPDSNKKESLSLEQIALEILKSMQPTKTPTEAVSHYKTILELLQR